MKAARTTARPQQSRRMTTSSEVKFVPVSTPSVVIPQAVGAALAYAEAGMAVFPVRADKTPLTPHGVKDATRDPASITAWWRLYPYADIGWAIPPSAVVIDIDRKNGRDGFKDFERMTGASADEILTPQASTPSSGRHLVCGTNSKAYRNGVRIAGLSIDLRAIGGYIVLPSPGNGRRWVRPLDTPFMTAPAWLPTADGAQNAHFSTYAAKAVQALVRVPEPGYRGDSPYGLATLKRVCADVVASPDGSQEMTLNAGAYKIGRLIGAGELSDAAVQSLIDAGLAMASYDASRPWDPALIEAKVRRAIGQGMRRPLPQASFALAELSR
jgi:hypothetical protein